MVSGLETAAMKGVADFVADTLSDILPEPKLKKTFKRLDDSGKMIRENREILGPGEAHQLQKRQVKLMNSAVETDIRCREKALGYIRNYSEIKELHFETVVHSHSVKTSSEKGLEAKMLQEEEDRLIAQSESPPLVETQFSVTSTHEELRIKGKPDRVRVQTQAIPHDFEANTFSASGAVTNQYFANNIYVVTHNYGSPNVGQQDTPFQAGQSISGPSSGDTLAMLEESSTFEEQRYGPSNGYEQRRLFASQQSRRAGTSLQTISESNPTFRNRNNSVPEPEQKTKHSSSRQAPLIDESVVRSRDFMEPVMREPLDFPNNASTDSQPSPRYMNFTSSESIEDGRLNADPRFARSASQAPKSQSANPQRRFAREPKMEGLEDKYNNIDAALYRPNLEVDNRKPHKRKDSLQGAVGSTYTERYDEPTNLDKYARDRTTNQILQPRPGLATSASTYSQPSPRHTHNPSSRSIGDGRSDGGALSRPFDQPTGTLGVLSGNPSDNFGSATTSRKALINDYARDSTSNQALQPRPGMSTNGTIYPGASPRHTNNPPSRPVGDGQLGAGPRSTIRNPQPGQSLRPNMHRTRQVARADSNDRSDSSDGETVDSKVDKWSMQARVGSTYTERYDQVAGVAVTSMSTPTSRLPEEWRRNEAYRRK